MFEKMKLYFKKKELYRVAENLDDVSSHESSAEMYLKLFDLEKEPRKRILCMYKAGNNFNKAGNRKKAIGCVAKGLEANLDTEANVLLRDLRKIIDCETRYANLINNHRN